MLGMLALALVAPAATVTTARLVTGSGLGWVILRALTPYATVLYALAALVLVVLAFRGAGPPRPVAVVPLVAVGGLLATHLVWAAGPFMGRVPDDAANRSFTVMTLNLHLGRADAASLVRAAEAERVDLLVLEEVTPDAMARLRAAGVERLLPHEAGEAKDGREGIVVLSRGEVLGSRTVPMSTPGYAVDLVAGGGRLRVVAVHPTAPNNGVARWASDLAVADQAASASSGPTLVAGDFNATVDHPPLRSLVDGGFRDAVDEARAGWLPTWPSQGTVRMFGVTLPPLFALDHVFLRGPLHAVDARDVLVPGTDHRALVVEVSWPSADRLSVLPGPG